MSRLYRVHVIIEGPTSGRETAIAEALMDFWGFEDVVATRDGFVTDADNNLTGGTTEDEFARELARRVWAANQGFCEVDVSMTYLEYLPSEDYGFAQDEYDDWMKTSSNDKLPAS